jgi:multidrug efflux pump subunit AcrB
VEKALNKLNKILKTDYPEIEFTVTRDQTKLLNYSINNLQQSLLVGGFLAFIIMFFFLKDIKSPLLIGISMPVSVIITLLLFYLSGISINIISLSGLILGIGMMIDNSIIVIDNINQHRERGALLDASCINGTNEVFRPLLSSILTTIAVYVPLVFVGGISGAMFYEQALAISIGLFVSLSVSITLIPVYYRLFYLSGNSAKQLKWFEKINKLDYALLYEKGFRLVMRNQVLSFSIIIIMLSAAFFLFKNLKKQQLPAFKTDEIMLYVDWNERINIQENSKRAENLRLILEDKLLQSTCFIGEQQFLLNFDIQNSASESLIYFKAKSSNDIMKIVEKTKKYIKENYPDAFFRFEDADNIFNVLFGDTQAPLIARLHTAQAGVEMDKNNLTNLLYEIRKKLPQYTIPLPETVEQIVLQTDPALLKLYDVSFSELYARLKTAFNEHHVLMVSGNAGFLPVVIGNRQQNIAQIISQTMIKNTKGDLIPLSNLVKESKDASLKYIIAGQEGVYYPLNFNVSDDNANELQNIIKEILKENKQFEVSFSGSVFENRALIKQIAIILLISLLLLYFILASQFESLTLPLIVLFEVPVDLFGAFFMLWLFDASINLMSLIGIIVMSGIIINDSILKIDTVNQLRRQGYSLMHALVEAGHRRLKPILMTSLTTILALLPFLFAGGLGAELQKPLALSIIGGMLLGTVVSLYLIPLLYYHLKR